MIEWFEALSTMQKVLFFFGSLGSLLFIIQIVMMLIGIGDSDADVDLDGDVDLDMDADLDADPGTDVDVTHADSDVAFKVISVQGIIAFFMMLGWTGLIMNRTFGFGVAVSTISGIGVGVAMNLLMAKIFQSFKRMQNSGTMDLKNAVGEEGTVYLTIKKDEPGKVRVAVQQHLKVFDAVSDDGTEIPTDSRVKVVRVVKGNTMVVKKI